MPLKTAPDAGSYPILEDGKYGQNGEAELTSITARCINWTDKKTGEERELYYVNFRGHVDDPNQGRVFFESAPFGGYNTQMGAKTGSLAPVMLAQLGLSVDKVEFDDTADENGNHALLGPNPCPMAVVVELVKQEPRNADDRPRNVLKSIWKA